MKKKAFFICCLPLLLGMASCSGIEEELRILATDIASVYMPQPAQDQSGNYVSAELYQFEYAITNRYGRNEAYVNLESPLSLLWQAGSYGREANVEKSPVRETDPTISYYISGHPRGTVTITVNAEEDTVTFSDWDVYRSLGSSYVSEICNTPLEGLNTNSNTYTPASSSFTFDLASYDIDILKYGEYVYLPMAVTSYIFMNPKNMFTSYNGEGFYFYSSTSYMKYGEDNEYTDFAKAYYGGSFKNRAPSSALATLHGNESMFFLDHFYGFPDRSDFNGRKFSQYLKEEHPTQYGWFFSTGLEDSQKAWDYVARSVIGDGHTSTTSNLGSFYTGGNYAPTAPYNQRRIDLEDRRTAIKQQRTEAWGLSEYSLPKERMFEVYEDMAVIRFDSFKTNNALTTWERQKYLDNMEDDLYSQFAYAFMEIEDNSEIKKVVIDLTCNGGGAVIACMEALCFLKDSIDYTIYNPLTGSFVNTSYGGVMPNERKTASSSYQGKYEFYVLTSSFSFSCGNLFPTICNTNGIAKMVGEKSGGGACVVSYTHTPDGQWVQISSTYRLCRYNNFTKESNDEGIEPDIVLDGSKFTDMEALRAALN